MTLAIKSEIKFQNKTPLYICTKMKNMQTKYFLGATLAIFFAACGNNPKESNDDTNTKTEVAKIVLPEFDADSAYMWVKAQCDFGPRIPGTKAHADAVTFLSGKLKTYTDTVIIQKAPVKTFDGKAFTMQNIIASFNPSNTNRVLLCAHFDTRPWADGEETDKYKPFMSADDGPTGAAVLIEVARQLQKQNTQLGVDIILLDMEDYGQEQDDTRYPQQESTWCMGSQYWARNPHVKPYNARYGILLDMVGGQNAVFPLEGTSLQYAPSQQRTIWDAANSLGFSNFTYAQTNPTIDDHLYINTIAGIPTVDIVHYDISKSGYAFWHHRQSDTMQNIDAKTLKQVGQTILYVLSQTAL